MRIDQMRVLMLVENNTYLKDVRVIQEATSLTKAGCQVSVICQSNLGRPWREVVDGVNVLMYPSPPSKGSFLAYVWEYGYSLIAMFFLSFFVLWQPGFDVIHAANPPDTAVIIAAFYKLFGKQFIFDHHDLAPEIYKLRFGSQKKTNRLVYQILVYFEKLSCQLADCVVATNQSFKLIEMERDHISGGKITIVRNGPALERFKPEDPILEIQQTGKMIIVYLGIMGFQDGVDHLLGALHNLVNKLGRSDFLCVIAGYGDALPSLKDQANQLGLNDFVLFPGFIEPGNVSRYISTAEICVAPEPSNILNDRSTIIKIMEYMAIGRPIVAYDLPEHRVTAGNAALYARQNDELDFAQKIATLMDDYEKRKELGLIGLDRVKNELAWAYQEKQLLAMYDRLAQRN
jgi:glycosyltransferase involved in cell wall biosynthesis